ncbi:hypothetical protein BGZ93_003825 [Podila epicladia]|nr:hypothetical protein BGZ93_003825 [Podila epicladia]
MAVPTLLTVTELKSKLGGPVVVDGSWHMPAAKRDPIKEFRDEGHIPGARYFDIESIKDKTSSLPHMMPSAAQFAQQVGELGISNDDHVVVYDTAFGHNKVSVLDGGFKAWKSAGYPIEKGDAKIEPRVFQVPNLDETKIRDYKQILHIVKDSNTSTTIIDARPSARFTGAAPEPRAGLSSGHMPGAKNVTFMELFDQQTGELYNDDQLLAAFTRAGVNVDELKKSESASKDVVLSCGSGVSACVVYFALERLGLKHLAVFDGSWTEYASRPESIIVKD